MSVFYITVALIIGFFLLLFIVLQTIINKKLFSMRDLGKFLPLALSYFCLTASTTLTKEGVTFATVINTIGGSFRTVMMFSFDNALLAALPNDAYLNAVFTFVAAIHVFLFFSVIISLFLRYSSNFIKKIVAISSKEHDVLLDWDVTFISHYASSFKKIMCWNKIKKDEFKNTKVTAPLLNSVFSVKSLIHYLRYAKNRVNFISITQDESEILKRLNIFVNAFTKRPDYFKNVYFYISVNIDNITLYNRIIEDTEFKSHIILYSRHSNYGDDFINRYPVSQVLDERFLDYSTASLKEGVGVNNFFIGLGGYNKQVLKQELIHSNLFKIDPNTKLFVPYAIDNHLFDIKPIIIDDLMDSSLGALMNVSEPAHYRIFKHEPVSAKLSKFYNEIDSIFVKNKNQKMCYRFFVSCGNDTINIDLALKLRALFGEKAEKIVVYCHVKSRHSIPLYGIKDPAIREKYQDIVFVGEEILFDNHEVIVNRSLESLAINKNSKYLTRSNVVSKEDGLKAWMSLPAIKRYNNSSVYINLRFKLNLMGLDYCKTEEAKDNRISKDEFIKRYLGGIDDYKEEFTRLLNYEYDDYYVHRPINNPRNLLSIAEHDRWNSYFYSCGYHRLPLNQVTYEFNVNTKMIIVTKEDRKYKLHACLCSVEELDAYHKQNRKKLDELNQKVNKENPGLNIDFSKLSSYSSLIDTYYFDYDSLDEIYEVLEENGLVLISKK